MTNKNINALMDSELDQVAGGNLAETKQFINAYLKHAKRNGYISQCQIDAMKSMPIEDQANLLMASVAKSGGMASLRVDSKRNQYIVKGQYWSHSQFINFLNTH